MKLVKGIILSVMVMFFCVNIYAQDDIIRLREIINLNSSPGKIDSLNKFKSSFPGSQYTYRADLELFNVYAALGNADSALHYAKLYTDFIPLQNRANAYNSVAFVLADNSIGLDTALSYTEQALVLLQSNPRYINLVKDTKAYVLYKKGDTKSAIDIQKEALVGNENNPEFLYHYALYLQATGSIDEALKNLAGSALYGNIAAVYKFNEWKQNDKNYSDLIMPVVYSYIENSGLENTFVTKSNAAAFIAQTGINQSLAEVWADSAYQSINKKTGYDDYVYLKKNYGIVKASGKNFKAALPALLDIEDLADPWLSDYWLTLGYVYKNLDQKEKALDAFTSGLTTIEDSVLLAAARSMAGKEQVEKEIEKKKEQMSALETGEYKADGKSSGKVVLAELFTGAECPPCVAADMAFDILSEYYPRNVLAILEYHLHIPGPDPLTNPDSYQRYLYYGADYGTPTAFFEGGEKITGGGPKIAALNRYNVYNYSIKKFLNDKPAAEFSGSAKVNGNTLDIDLSVKPNSGNINKTALHIVVAEKEVNYTGANGIGKHIFVVRDLVEGQQGTELSLSEKNEIKRTVNLDTLRSTISKYLTDPTTDASWKQPQFTGWRNDTNILSAINEKDLAVIAWLQDPVTKEVLQAYYMDVK